MATQTLEVPPGIKSLSLQYHSQVPLTVYVDGRGVGELPASLEGFYLTGAGRGAFWPSAMCTGEREPWRSALRVGEPSGFQDFFGVERKVWLGDVAVATYETTDAPLADVCGEYVDHYISAP